ncbi:hypothetical protein LXM94_00925 [Rhizobium sp. TRM95111]|uniref:hypothetical protein n=1 Tax=Rhizobium alarense TaxID=2846851 RepID=UPI001F3BC549|nr:hypothetical protein [Rhizobium alarense]MCF3638530.1 hypothetical protein [Rhizobium alarense]
MKLTATTWAICLRMLCAVALVFVGLAHRPVAAAPATPLELAAYVLPDGTIADLCVGDAVGGGKKHAANHGCEACRIAGALLLPQPADFTGRVLAYRIVADRPLVEAVRGDSRYQPGAPPRAPPVFLA